MEKNFLKNEVTKIGRIDDLLTEVVV